MNKYRALFYHSDSIHSVDILLDIHPVADLVV